MSELPITTNPAKANTPENAPWIGAYTDKPEDQYMDVQPPMTRRDQAGASIQQGLDNGKMFISNDETLSIEVKNIEVKNADGILEIAKKLVDAANAFRLPPQMLGIEEPKEIVGLNYWSRLAANGPPPRWVRAAASLWTGYPNMTMGSDSAADEARDQVAVSLNRLILVVAKAERWSDRKIIEKLSEAFPMMIAQFDDHDHCTELLVPGGSRLSTLPPLYHVETLRIDNCHLIRSLPDLPRVRHLCVHGCVNLTSLPALPNVRILCCQLCASLTSLPVMPHLESIVCSFCTNLKPSEDFKWPQSDAWYAPWQEKGLMPRDPEKGILLWKSVSPDLHGNLGYSYRLGEEFQNTGMACAGPFGALRDFNNHKKAGSRVMAIWATCAYPASIERGIYHVLRGTPAAVYLAKDLDEEGFTPMFLAGEEDDAMRSVLFGQGDEN